MAPHSGYAIEMHAPLQWPCDALQTRCSAEATPNPLCEQILDVIHP